MPVFLTILLPILGSLLNAAAPELEKLFPAEASIIAAVAQFLTSLTGSAGKEGALKQAAEKYLADKAKA